MSRRFAFQQRDGGSSDFGRWVGGLGVFLVCLLIWLSADPSAHERFHHDADRADHQCVVTEFSAGEAYYLAPRILIRPGSAHREVRRVAAIVCWQPAPAFLLPPGCGPPVFA